MLGRETIPPGEAEAIRVVVEASRVMAGGGDENPARRGQHAKHHGCVRAEFVVEPGLPEAYRVGLFREPKTYPAWVRFSNGARADDREPDAHGMAVKLMGVGGAKVLDAERDATTHDFVMVDDPAFFLPDAAEYARFSTAMLKARGFRPSLVRRALGVLPEKPRTLLTLILLYFVPFRLALFFRLKRFAGKTLVSPLTTRYWGTTPYLFGEGMAMKFTAVPDAVDAGPPGGGSADYLAGAMAEHLRARGASFDFRVQLQKDERATPVEDPTVPWGEDVAPPRTVARLTIPAQEFGGRARSAFCEDLSFTPWHAVPEHRPLGGINRVRKDVYTELSLARHGRNATPSREPEPDDPPVGPLSLASGLATFDEVLAEELRLIRARRAAVEGAEVPAARDPEPPDLDTDRRTMAARVDVLNEHVAGLAFSGGGVRSATFAVGVLQGLATLNLLNRFDYLSTVSGGGYAGAWVAAWLKRDGRPANVERQLNVNRVKQSQADREYLAHGAAVDEEPEPLRHLRSYSSYMAPRPGLTSVDTWTILLIWARNVVINLMMLLPAALVLVALARLVVSVYGLFNTTWQGEDPREWLAVLPLLVFGAVWLWLAFERNGRALGEFRTRDTRRRLTPGRGAGGSVVTRGIVYPALAGAFCLTVSLRWVLARLGTWLDRPPSEVVAGLRSWFDVPPERTAADVFKDPAGLWRVPWDYLRSNLGLLQPPVFLLHALLLGVLIAGGAYRIANRDRPAGGGGEGAASREWAVGRRKAVWAGFFAGATGGVLLVLLEALTAWFSGLDRPDLMATFVPPLALLVLVAGLIVEVAVLGRRVGEAEREWWARVSALLTLSALGWAGVMATVVYVPGLYLSAGPVVRAAVASGWLGSAAFGVVTGRYVLPKVGGGRGVTTLASVASQVFLVGLLGAVALLAAAVANVPSLAGPHGDALGPFAYYLEGVKGASFLTLVALLAGSYVLYRLARGLIDVNLFSLHAMYVNRLTRAYLGASRAKANWPGRWAGPHDPRVEAGAPCLDTPAGGPAPTVRDPNPVTGFDPGDDLDLVDLRIGSPPDARGRTYLGPHLLVNTTLNLVGGGDLAWRDRKGESFTLSPLYCGAKSLGYAPTDDTREALTLGRAVAISGAAVDPNMSFYQSAPLTALLTLFNARLGYWVGKPRGAGWKAPSPKFGDLLFTEFFGRTDGTGDFVHISDGGHFENLGVYELIRRRCRYIVAVDAAEDVDASDDNLATLVRLCRIDFGVRIRIDTDPVRVSGPDNLSRAHAVVGRIHYDDVDQGEMPGVLVYIKASMTGDEPPDVQKYARKEPAFPHQPTDLRQEFGEEQFECYRCLGDHVAREVFHEPVSLLREALGDATPPPPHRVYVPRLFSAVQARWAETPRGQGGAAGVDPSGWDRLRRDLMTLPELERLSRDVYPELPPAPPEAPAIEPAARHRAEWLAVARMLDVMEGAWLELGRKRFSGLPMNRGWMNAFRRWTASRAFQLAWPALRAERSSDFVRFCEDQLRASTAPPAAVRLRSLPDAESPAGRAVAGMAAEFAREWPDAGRDLRDLIGRASRLVPGDLPVWLIELSPSGPRRDGEETTRAFPAGVILAAPFDDHPDRDALAAAGETPVELFVWVRPYHRSAGLATRTARDVVKTIDLELKAHARDGGKPRLWARYPRAAPGDDDHELGLWLGFFARYDFRLTYPKPHDAGRPFTLLRRV